MKLRFTTALLAALAALALPAAASASEGYAGTTINGRSVEYEATVGAGEHIAFFVTLHNHRITKVTEFGASVLAQCALGTDRIGAGLDSTIKVSKSGTFSASGTSPSSLPETALQVTISGHFEDKGRKVAGTMSASGSYNGQTSCTTGTISFTAK